VSNDDANIQQHDTANSHLSQEEDTATKPPSDSDDDDRGSLSLNNISSCDANSLPILNCNFKTGTFNKRQFINGTVCIDSGAAISVLGNTLLWEGQAIKPWKRGPIKLADGSLRYPEGEMDFKFSIGKKQFTTRFALLPTCDFTMLLGMNFLRNSGMVIDFADLHFWFKDKPQQVFNFEKKDVSSCTVRSLQLFSEWQKQEIKKLLLQFPTVFDAPTIGKTDAAEHTIQLKEDKPLLLKPYPYSETKHAIIDPMVDKMLQQGLIEESNSPYSSPLILRPKPGGDWRLVHDYRHVNKLTVPDAFPIKKISEMLRVLAEAKYLSTIDLEKGFWQVPLKKSDRHLTAFQTRKGLFQYRVMPQGLRNSPATFQRLMNKVLRGTDAFTFTYQDDILVFSKNFDDHLTHIRTVLQRLKQANLTVKSDKCQFGRDTVKFLGHIISSKGIEKNPEKVTAIRGLSSPKTRKHLRKFLGAMGWFQNFVPSMATTATPLYRLLRLNRKFKWLPEHEQAFQQLKDDLANKTLLHHPDFSKPFYLRTDASNTGVSGYLFQLDEEGNELPIAFFSKSLTPTQENYATVEKEENYATVLSPLWSTSVNILTVHPFQSKRITLQ